jgi:hypothetical protein
MFKRPKVPVAVIMSSSNSQTLSMEVSMIPVVEKGNNCYYTIEQCNE